MDLDLLPEAPVVLDVGARAGAFALAMLQVRPKADVICVEPDASAPVPEGLACIWAALVGDGRREDEYFSYSTGEGNWIGRRGLGDAPVGIAHRRVPCTNLLKIMHAGAGIAHFDLIKLDCEGSEFQILENLWAPIATQITVEFHDFSQLSKWNELYYAWLWSQLPWYRVVQHELTKQGDHLGHWDSLLVAKENN